MVSQRIHRVISPKGRVYEYIYPKTVRKKTEHHPDFKYKPRLDSVKPKISIRKQCLERDNYTCQICGEISSKLDIHHRDNMGRHLTKTPNNHLSNLQTLCHKCHLRLHYGVIEKHKEIMELRKTGLTLREIGQQFGGVSRQCIHQILLKYILTKGQKEPLTP